VNASARHAAGFTLVELIVVLAVVSILFATAMPLAGAAIDSARRTEASTSLATIADALEKYYYDHAAWPAAIDAAGFAGTYFSTGVGARVVVDPFGAGAQYLYAVDNAANTVKVWSRGDNGRDDGFANEDFAIAVAGAVPGLQRTRERMRVIVAAMTLFLDGGGALTGTFATDRAAMGLGTDYATDGFGTAFTLDASTRQLRSAGPDRVMGTADDLTS
jgi:prepilin-type N-terminal cleavage/methylation domain-containing protein